MNRKTTPARLLAAVLFTLLSAFVLVSIATPTAPSVAAQSAAAADDAAQAGGPASWTLPVTFRAFAVDMSGTTARTRSGTLEITVERWSTDEEQERLKDALVESGSAKLLSTLQKVRPRVGYIRSYSSIGWDIYYAREVDTPSGGKRVILATDRPMSFFEAWNRPRRADYEFTLVEMRFSPDGKGEGKLVPAAKVTYDQDTRTVEMEDYGIEPVRLTQIQAYLPKTAQVTK